MTRIPPALATTIMLLAGGVATAANLDDALDARFKGAWIILGVEIHSSCSATYSDNTIGPAGVASKAGRRFDAGELAKIDKVKVKRARVDLLVTLAEPILVAHREGPFELFDERVCKAQLIFEFPRAVIKQGDLDAVTSAIDAALTTHASLATAREADDWNGRVRKPYPPDYDQTLALYEIWVAEQTNAAVAAAIEDATTEAAEAAEDIDRDADYLDGFAAGAEEMRSLDIDDCPRLIDASFHAFKKGPPSDASGTWKRGFSDGQSLVFHLYLARELGNCFVPIPAAPLP